MALWSEHPIIDEEFDDLESYAASIAPRIKDGRLDTSADGEVHSGITFHSDAVEEVSQARAERLADEAMERAQDAARATQAAVMKARLIERERCKAEFDAKFTTPYLIRNRYILTPEQQLKRQARYAGGDFCGEIHFDGRYCGSVYALSCEVSGVTYRAWNTRFSGFPNEQVQAATDRLFGTLEKATAVLAEHGLTFQAKE